MNFRTCSLYASVVLIAVALVFGAGCLSTTNVEDSAAGLIHTHYQYQDSWSPEYGCYDDLTGYVYSTGNVSTTGLKLDFNLVNTGTGPSGIHDRSISEILGRVRHRTTRQFLTASARRITGLILPLKTRK